MYALTNKSLNLTRKSLLTGLILVVSSFAACTFQNNDEVFTHIEKGSPRNFTIDFFNTQDTVYLGSAMALNFNPPEADIIGSAIFLDDDKVFESTSGPLRSYYMRPEYFTSGYKKLRVEYYQKTKSGSLADKMDAEVFTIAFEKTVLIDNEFVHALKIIKTEIVDSTLVIYWNTFEGYKFGSYRVRADNLDTTIYDKTIDHLAIPNYGGGNISFNFSINAKIYENRFSVESYHYDLNVKAIQKSQDSLAVSWDASPFRAMQGMQLTYYANGVYSSVNLLSGSKPVDTVFYYPVDFPFEYLIHVNSLIKPNAYGHEVTQSSLQLASPYAYGLSGSVTRQLDQNNFVVVKYDSPNDAATIYDNTTKTEKVRVSGPAIAISHNGKSVFKARKYSQNSYFIEELNENLAVKSSELLTLPGTGSIQWLHAMHVSDDQYLLIQSGPSQYGFGSYFTTYHWPTRTIVYSGTLVDLVYRPSKNGWLAKGGRYFIHPTTHFDLSTSPPSYRITDPARSSTALNMVHLEQYVTYYSSSKELRVKTFLGSTTPVFTIPVEGMFVQFMYNEYNDLAVLLKKSDGTYWVEVYDLDSGVILGKLRIATKAIEDNSYEFKFFGNYLSFKVGWANQTNTRVYLHKFDFEL